MDKSDDLEENGHVKKLVYKEAVFSAFEQFVGAVLMARNSDSSPEAMAAMGTCFEKLLETLGAVGIKKERIAMSCRVNRTTLDRWEKGQSIPHRGTLAVLRQYVTSLFPPQEERRKRSEVEVFARMLLDPRFQFVARFVVDQQHASVRVPTAEEIVTLCELAERSKKVFNLDYVSMQALIVSYLGWD